jgi:hypothetical protein
MSAFSDDFEAHLKEFRSPPFLFVGAGLSRRYLALDGWEALLRRMADLTGKDFDYYAASANGDLPQVATLIAEELHDPWWSEERFKTTRDRFKGMLHHRDSALKAEASAYVADSMKVLPTSGDLADELELLREAMVDGIITTNFDPLLDHLFPDFEIFVGQERLMFSEAMGVGEIYKIRGSHEDPDSLVLTRADYDRFNERNPYLAAKLTTYFVEHPIVFLGYSLSDENVGTILNAIVSCLDSKESIAKLADRLIFVQWEDGVAPTLAASIIRVEGTPIPTMMATVPDFREIFGVMSGMKRRFSAKLLRQLKEQVFELVLENDPKGKLHVLPLDPKVDPREAELVYGVGAIAQWKSYVGLSRQDLIADVLDDNVHFVPARVVHETLPAILSHPGNVPIYKYLRGAGLLDKTGKVLDPSALDPRVAKHVAARATRLEVLAGSKARAAAAVKNAPTFEALVATVGVPAVLWLIPALGDASIDAEELKQFLLNNEGLSGETNRSQWVKMVCLYDWLRWGRGPAAPKLRPTRRRKRLPSS